MFNYHHLVWNPKKTTDDKPKEGEDDVKSACPLHLGRCVLQWLGQRVAIPRGQVNLKNLALIWIVGCNLFA